MEGIGGDCVKCFLALAVSTGFGMMFQHFQMSESNIIMLYLLGILLAAMTVSRRGQWSYLLCSACFCLISFL